MRIGCKKRVLLPLLKMELTLKRASILFLRWVGEDENGVRTDAGVSAEPDLSGLCRATRRKTSIAVQCAVNPSPATRGKQRFARISAFAYWEEIETEGSN